MSVVDQTPIYSNILDDPKSHGAPNATCYNDDGYSCLWWNNFHPGLAIQSAVGQAVYEALNTRVGGEDADFYSGLGGVSSKALTFAALQSLSESTAS